MIRVVGWLVVTCFSLYGVAQFVERHVVANKGDDSKRPIG